MQRKYTVTTFNKRFGRYDDAGRFYGSVRQVKARMRAIKKGLSHEYDRLVYATAKGCAPVSI